MKISSSARSSVLLYFLHLLQLLLFCAFILVSCEWQPAKETPQEIIEQLLPVLLAAESKMQNTTIAVPDPADTLDGFSKRRTRFLLNYQARYGTKIAVFIGKPEEFDGKILTYYVQSMLAPHPDLPPELFDTIPEYDLVQALSDSLQKGQPLPIASLRPPDSSWTYVCCMKPEDAFAFAEVAVSTVGFNTSHTEGCFYFAFYGGPLNAYGSFVFIKKVAGRWIIVSKNYGWVA